MITLTNFKWYRRLKGGVWHKHKNTYQLPGLYFNYFWARYGKTNRYTTVIKTEQWQ